MSLTILDIKPTITRDDETFVDLTYPSVRYNYDPYVTGVVVMNEQFEMRPDLVSKNAYSNTEYWDFILKYNGVSNPFSISRDDMFLVPAFLQIR